MTILIDADGCPVVDVTIKVARYYNIKCIILCDTSHYYEREGATTITVPKGADSVDFALVNMLNAGDVVVTQDYGLAAMCLARQAIPINQNGILFTNENIDAFLFQRYMAKKIRMSGGKLRGSSKRKSGQSKSYETKLRELLQNKL